MLGLIWGWLRDSAVGQALALLGSVLIAVFFVRADAKRTAKREVLQDENEKDRERAAAIRARVDAALAGMGDNPRDDVLHKDKRGYRD